MLRSQRNQTKRAGVEDARKGVNSSTTLEAHSLGMRLPDSPSTEAIIVALM